MRVLVIGGGVIGTTTAYYLTRAGHEVTVVDRADSLAAEGSFANGGMLHAGNSEPWNTPAAIRQLIQWIGREESPLLLRPGQISDLIGWGFSFLRYSRAHHHERNTRVNARLSSYSQRMMRELRAQTGIRYDDEQRGILKIYRGHTAFEHGLASSRLIENLGVGFQTLGAEALIELEPALAEIRDELSGGIFYPSDEAGDVRLFTRRLGELAAQQGAMFRLGESVRRITGDARGVRAVETDRGTLSADRYVLAAGVDAPLLARPLGLHLPIKPVKGYSATLPAHGVEGAPRLPIIDHAHRVVITRLGERLRIAGTAEFAGYDRSIRRGRVDMVIRHGLSNFPRYARNVDLARAEHWACLRPMTVDGPPILGRSPVPNLLLNVGAGHLGWTFAAGAARVVADVLDEREPEIDLAGLTLERYRH